MTVAPSITPLTTRGTQYKRPLSKTNRHGWFQWGYHVVPTSLLRDFLIQHFEGRHEWKEQFYFDVAFTLKLDQKAVARRMRDVWTCTSAVTKASYADAACIALGLELDRDTNIPTLPGNLSLAKEMILLRADEELDEMTLERLARKTHRICALICGYPHNVERLLDLAPYNCLRLP